jgi:hypothetical protein
MVMTQGLNPSRTVTKQTSDHLVLSPDDETVLNNLYQKTLLQFDLTASFMTMREPAIQSPAQPSLLPPTPEHPGNQ